MRDAGRWALRTVAALVLVLAVLSGTVLPLVYSPAYTRSLMLVTGGPDRADLSEGEAVSAAEDVREVVVGTPASTLPDRVDRREGFGPDEREHLEDVAAAVGLARRVALLSLTAAVLWVWASTRYDPAGIGAVLKAAGCVLTAAVPIAALAALADFGWFFAGFHGLFFEAGTWTFHSGSLLVQLFPERFWIVSGAVWGGLVLSVGVALLLLGIRLCRNRRQRDWEV